MTPDVISQFCNEDDGYRSSFFVSGTSYMSSVCLPLEYSCDSGWSTPWNLSSETGFSVHLGGKAWSTGKWIQITGSIFLSLQCLCLNLIGISFWGFYWDIGVRQPILSDRHVHKLQRHVIALNGSQLQL